MSGLIDLLVKFGTALYAHRLLVGSLAWDYGIWGPLKASNLFWNTLSEACPIIDWLFYHVFTFML